MLRRRVTLRAVLCATCGPQFGPLLHTIPSGVPRAGHSGRFGPIGQQVRAALAALPKQMRAVVVLRYWLDLSIDETARMLGCSHGTVKSQAAKGTAKLRLLLPAPSHAAGGQRIERTNP